VLWRRLLLAVQRLEGGDSVTAAAHAAGFADAAHLSRSFRKVIGAAPSELRLP
jgi:AraC-like DNA-binding protein